MYFFPLSFKSLINLLKNQKFQENLYVYNYKKIKINNIFINFLNAVIFEKISFNFVFLNIPMINNY